jgi:hypothetical protein
MGINSTEVSYNFGQMGSIIANASAVLSSNDVSGMGEAVFCAITFIEDSTFTILYADTTGLYPGSATASTLIDAHGVTTSGITFPAGLTIYGRWTNITLATGKAVAYIGY